MEILDGLKFLSKRAELRTTKVYLVNSADHLKAAGVPYVTLSHCWGKPKSVQSKLKLTTETKKRFMEEGIELHELPKVSY